MRLVGRLMYDVANDPEHDVVAPRPFSDAAKLHPAEKTIIRPTATKRPLHAPSFRRPSASPPHMGTTATVRRRSPPRVIFRPRMTPTPPRVFRQAEEEEEGRETQIILSVVLVVVIL